MAYVANTNVPVRSDIAGRISALIASFQMRANQYRTYRRTLSELSLLTNRELADLGIHRSSIRNIAIESAYGEA